MGALGGGLGVEGHARALAERPQLVPAQNRGPRCAQVAGRDELEISWTVVPEHWNQGLATELGAASLEIAFGPLGLAAVVSFTLPTATPRAG